MNDFYDGASHPTSKRRSATATAVSVLQRVATSPATGLVLAATAPPAAVILSGNLLAGMASWSPSLAGHELWDVDAAAVWEALLSTIGLGLTGKALLGRSSDKATAYVGGLAATATGMFAATTGNATVDLVTYLVLTGVAAAGTLHWHSATRKARMDEQLAKVKIRGEAAKVKVTEAKADLIHQEFQLKADLTQAKINAMAADAAMKLERSKIKHEQELVRLRMLERKELAELRAMHPQDDGPDLTGLNDVEAQFTTIVWKLFGQKVRVHATVTGADWTATVTMPLELSRDSFRRDFAKVESAFGLTGSFFVTKGLAGNQLNVRYAEGVDVSRMNLIGWTPGACWAINTATGEEVPVPIGRRMLFAGTSGSGKTWSAGPLMAEASEYQDHRLILVDFKMTTARNWAHRARIATNIHALADVLAEVIAEGQDRLAKIPRGQDVVSISADTPRITFFVDEGADVLAKIASNSKRYGQLLADLEEVAAKFRAAEIHLVWCTQAPYKGKDGGISPLIASNLPNRLSMLVADATQSGVVFGAEAPAKGWNAHELPGKGWAMLRDMEGSSDPDRLKMRAIDPADIIRLPSRPVWCADGDCLYEGDEQYLAQLTQTAPMGAGQSYLDDAGVELDDDPFAPDYGPDDAQALRDEGKSVRQVAALVGKSVGWVSGNTTA